MATKRTYKALTATQGKKAKRYIKQGFTQAQAAKKVGVAKQRVSTFLQKAKVGKRRPSPFWQEVRIVKEATGHTHKEATRFVYHAPKWGMKRHGEGYLTPEERYQAMRDKRAEFDYKGKLNEKDQKEVNAYGDEIGLGDTPK